MPRRLSSLVAYVTTKPVGQDFSLKGAVGTPAEKATSSVCLA